MKKTLMILFCSVLIFSSVCFAQEYPIPQKTFDEIQSNKAQWDVLYLGLGELKDKTSPLLIFSQEVKSFISAVQIMLDMELSHGRKKPFYKWASSLHYAAFASLALPKYISSG